MAIIQNWDYIQIFETLNTLFPWVKSCFTNSDHSKCPSSKMQRVSVKLKSPLTDILLHSKRTCSAYPTSPRYRKSQWRAIVYISHKEVWNTARKTKNCVTSLLYLTKQFPITEFKNSNKSLKSSANHF